MIGTYYAVTDANGPISVRIEASSVADAAAWFEAQETNFVDDGRIDAEDDLEIQGDGMDAAEFAEAMEERGWSTVCSDICGDGQWSLWARV